MCNPFCLYDESLKGMFSLHLYITTVNTKKQRATQFKHWAIETITGELSSKLQL